MTSAVIRRTKPFGWALLAIVLFYLLSVRLVITWAQWAPDQFSSVVERVTGSDIAFEALQIEQNWLGVTLHTRQLLVEHENYEFEVGRLAVDVNLFATLLPQASIGEFLEIEDLMLWRFNALEPQHESDALAPQLSLSALEKQMDRLRIDRLWKRVDVNRLSVASYVQGELLNIDLTSFQAYKGANWSLAADLSLSYGRYVQQVPFQFKGSFRPNLWGGLQEGRFGLNALSPMRLRGLVELLPPKWQEVMPEGELLLEFTGQMAQKQLADLSVELYAQALHWPEQQSALPNTVGARLEWQNQSRVREFSEERWRFALSELQMDDRYVRTVAPVALYLTSERNLHFATAKFDIEPFKQIVQAVLKNESLADLLEASTELSVENVAGDIDVETLNVHNLSLEVAKLQVPATELPGLAFEQVYFDKVGPDFQVIVDQPFWVVDTRVHATPMRVDLPNRISGTFDQAEGLWEVNPVALRVDDMRAQLSARGDFSGQVEASATLEPDTLQTLKQYLPYALMSDKLGAWLETALVEGESVKGEVFFKGQARELASPARWDLPENQGLFGGVVSVKNAKLQFQPDWPAIENLDAVIEFTPQTLTVRSDRLDLAGGVNAQAVSVEVSHLNQSDIALEVRGQVHADAPSALAYLQRTPLPAKVGLDEWLADPAKVSMQGELAVDLQSVWIPLHGYDDRDDKVLGTLRLEKSNLQLFEKIEFQALEGQLVFTEQSVQGKKLRALVEGGQAYFDVETDSSHHNIRILGSGVLSADYPGIVTGEVDWSGRLNIPLKKQSAHSLSGEVKWNAAGAQWQMPAPLDASVMNGESILGWTLLDGALHGQGRIAHLGAFVFKRDSLGEEDATLAASVLLGGQDPFKLQLEPGKVAITGTVAALDLDGWAKWRSPERADPESTWFKDLLWGDSRVTFDQVQLLDQIYPALNLKWQSLDREQLAFHAEAPYLQAVATFNHPQQVLDVNASRLQLTLPEKVFDQAAPVDEARAKELLQICQAKTPSLSILPKVNFNGSNLFVDEVGIRNLAFQLEDSQDDLHFKHLNAQFANQAGVLTGEYFFYKRSKLSFAELAFVSNNVKNLSALLGLKQGFTGKRAEGKANLVWPGGVECFDWIGVTGKAGFEVRDGVIENVEPGFARLLGLLNINSLARRLSLNLEDVTTKGMAYDSIKSGAQLKNGYLTLEDFLLEAPSATVGLTGKVNLLQRQYDLKAQVTPSLGSSLPALSAITGIASPLGALAFYTLMKILPDVNEDLISYRYDVTGPWDAPNIKERNNNETAPSGRGPASGFDELLDRQ